MLSALENRPEVDQALQQVRAACVRLKMAKHELLPLLNLAVETYVSGLEGRSGISTAWTNPFREGEPSYSVSLQFEMPLGNRAAVARYSRQRLEAEQVVDQFRTTMELLMAEVEIAVREVNTAYQELCGQYRAMRAADREHEYFQKRWSLLPGEDQATSFLLEDLLNSQDRLAAMEFAYAEAEINYSISLSSLLRATSQLLDREQVSIARSLEGDGPRLELYTPQSISR